jgi:hypothetical protein
MTPTNNTPPTEPEANNAAGAGCMARLVVPVDSPWIVVDGSYDTLEVHTAKGEYVCSVHGDTLGVQCDRARLIADAPRLLERCRNLESALHRLLTADTPRPLAGIIDDAERQAAIEWILGADNAVCTKCGYTLPKASNLPTRGLQSP